MSGTVLAQARMSALASLRAVHAAFRWLHLNEQQMRHWQMEFLAIAAPPFLEQDRAQWFLEQFRQLGLIAPEIDAEGNVLGTLPAAGESERVLVLSAHLDTVFPPGTDTISREDGTRMLAPGACDNGAGLTALLALAAALREAGVTPARTILFAANVGEEGAGDLRGMRYLLERGPYRERVCGVLALEGAGTATAVDRALGSVRLRVTINGPGGHSWTDAEVPNPILLLARGLSFLADRIPSARSPLIQEPRTTFSAGEIAGGFSVNAIPEHATVTLDVRSTDPEALRRQELEIHRTFEQVVAQASRDQRDMALRIERIGFRPAAALPATSPLRDSLLAVDRHLRLGTELRLGSTDANLPLALGIPALALAAGGSGGGLHTLREWYDPTGREMALRRVLLLLLHAAEALE